jgi:hypothetical protein
MISKSYNTMLYNKKKHLHLSLVLIKLIDSFVKIYCD